MKFSKQQIKTSIIIALAYVGAIIGAGFASGQEVLQYFVSHGVWGIAGAVIATVLFSITGLIVLQLGAKYNASSHETVFEKIAPTWLHKFLDIALSLTLVVVGIVMIAGAGSNLDQQFGLPVWVGSLACALLVIAVGFMDISKVIGVISAATPVLLLFVFGVAIYSIVTADTSLESVEAVAQTVDSATPNWFLSSINYVSLAVMCGVSMALVMGGDEDKPKVAGAGGFLGGLLIGLLIIAATIALLLNIHAVAGDEMPLLALIDSVHPVLGTIMSVVLFVMIFNSVLSLYFALAKRLANGHEERFKYTLIIPVVLSFFISFVGFKMLLSIFYPLVGYVGMALIALLLVTWYRNTKRRLTIANDESNDLSFRETKV